MFLDELFTQIGYVRISASNIGVIGITISDEPVGSPLYTNHHTKHCKEQLEEYFAGQLQKFNVPLDYGDASGFYLDVWKALSKIEYGKTSSYSQIAQSLGHPKAVRAVGAANGKNPFAIVIPCHRVIGSNGNLTGYAHGLDKKKKLLMIENPKVYGYQKSLF